MSETINTTPKIDIQPEHPAPEMNGAEPFEYQLLTGHELPDGTHLTDEQLRMKYLQLADGLIYKMTDGIEVTNPQTGEKSKETPDVVVWLDKSARPLSWLVKEMWSKHAADPETGEVPKIPDFKFVNIDREQWTNTIDPEGVGSMDLSKVDKSIIRSLRSIFVSPKHKQEGLTEEIDEAPAYLDNKTVMIVDETKNEGKTLLYAQKFFSRAFPTARIAGAYWTTQKFYAGGKEMNFVPVWYKEKNIYGRGVANRNDRVSRESASLTQRLGAWFLSTTFKNPDVKALQLKREFHELAHTPDVPVLPHISRMLGKEDKAARLTKHRRLIEALNGRSYEEVLDDKQRIEEQR